jgi:hypothetical protein
VGSLDLPFLGGSGRVQFIFFGSVESFTLTLGSCEKRVPRFKQDEKRRNKKRQKQQKYNAVGKATPMAVDRTKSLKHKIAVQQSKQ